MEKKAVCNWRRYEAKSLHAGQVDLLIYQCYCCGRMMHIGG